MNRIKIIKRDKLQQRQQALKVSETATKKVNPALIKRQAVNVVENWINEWRASKPKDAGRGFADLFNVQSAAVG